MPSALQQLPRSETLMNKDVEKTFVGLSKAQFAAKVTPSGLTSKNLGNMYAGSLWGAFASLIYSTTNDQLEGKRVAMYSYGSGLAASFFSIKVVGNTDEMRQKLDLTNRLAKCEVRPCQEYVEALQVGVGDSGGVG